MSVPFNPNPYVRAAVRKQQELRALRLPPATPGGLDWTEGMVDFIDATFILGGGNSSRIMTARAHKLTDEEIAKVRSFLARDRDIKVAKLVSYDAPACVIKREQKGSGPLSILERIMRKRGLIE